MDMQGWEEREDCSYLNLMSCKKLDHAYKSKYKLDLLLQTLREELCFKKNYKVLFEHVMLEGINDRMAKLYFVYCLCYIYSFFFNLFLVSIFISTFVVSWIICIPVTD